MISLLIFKKISIGRSMMKKNKKEK